MCVWGGLGRRMTHTSDSERSLISAAERSRAHFIRLVFIMRANMRIH